MNPTNVLHEILVWSTGRPLWQRDALRRLVTKGALDDSDSEELAAICKAAHGLSPPIAAHPLSADDLPDPHSAAQEVSLVSLTHHQGVNALATDQTISFGPDLTIVFGENAAGKSGYTRILKRACRARGAESIRGNVLAGAPPSRPSATVVYEANGHEEKLSWRDDHGSKSPLTRVSVFDHHSAGVYLADRTDVAYRPQGLDLFDKLATACEVVRKLLEKEQRELAKKTLNISGIRPGTSVYDLLNTLTSLTDPDTVRQLAQTGPADKVRLEDVERQINELSSDNPERTAASLELRARRLTQLAGELVTLSTLFSDSMIGDLLAERRTLEECDRKAQELQDAVSGDQPLPGVGSHTWRALWDAASHHSEHQAYPERPFPFTGTSARCVLCHQTLASAAKDRLRTFSVLASSETQHERDRAEAEVASRIAPVSAFSPDAPATVSGLDELELESVANAEASRQYLTSIQARKLALLAEGDAAPTDVSELPPLAVCPDGIDLAAETLRGRATQLRSEDRAEARRALELERDELRARFALSDALDDVIREIDRRKRYAAYELCLRDTQTNAITRKSSSVTKVVVTNQLRSQFQSELSSLGFHHVEVELVPAGGSRGALYHQLRLTRAPEADVPKIVSEGEARCLSIASFFAELSTASEHSAILFDDPVSSLDHTWRRRVATRLVEEAISRQVVVFTHDVVFLSSLRRHADTLDVNVKYQHLRRESTAAGFSAQELPWIAAGVKRRIGILKNLWQVAEKCYRKGTRQNYEQKASSLYGRLREAWERAVEEVLPDGIVERYKPEVETKRARRIADITQEDCALLEKGMAKCSAWLLGHDQPAADNTPMPVPDEIKADIETLESWVAAIRRRRS